MKKVLLFLVPVFFLACNNPLAIHKRTDTMWVNVVYKDSSRRPDIARGEYDAVVQSDNNKSYIDTAWKILLQDTMRYSNKKPIFDTAAKRFSTFTYWREITPKDSVLVSAIPNYKK